MKKTKEPSKHFKKLKNIAAWLWEFGENTDAINEMPQKVYDYIEKNKLIAGKNRDQMHVTGKGYKLIRYVDKKRKNKRRKSNPQIGDFMKQNQMLMLAAVAAGAYWWFKIRKPATQVISTTGIPGVAPSSSMIAGMGIMPSGMGIMPTMGRRR